MLPGGGLVQNPQRANDLHICFICWGTIWRLLPGHALRWQERISHMFLKYHHHITCHGNMSTLKFSFVHLLSVTLNLWSPFSIPILLYMPWRITRLLFTFLRVCFWRIVTSSERGHSASFQAITAVVGTAAVWSRCPFPDKVKKKKKIPKRNSICFKLNFL